MYTPTPPGIQRVATQPWVYASATMLQGGAMQSKGDMSGSHMKKHADSSTSSCIYKCNVLRMLALPAGM